MLASVTSALQRCEIKTFEADELAAAKAWLVGPEGGLLQPKSVNSPSKALLHCATGR